MIIGDGCCSRKTSEIVVGWERKYIRKLTTTNLDAWKNNLGVGDTWSKNGATLLIQLSRASLLMILKNKIYFLKGKKCCIQLYKRCYNQASTSNYSSTLKNKYFNLINAGIIHEDYTQLRVLDSMDKTFSQLQFYNAEMREYQIALKSWNEERERLREILINHELKGESERFKKKTNIWSWITKTKTTTPESGTGLWVKYLNREKRLDENLPPKPIPPSPLRGFYLYGSVGCGKTLMMDLMFDASKQKVGKALRVHFNSAMLEVHQLMNKEWKLQREENKKKDLLKYSWTELESRMNQDLEWKNSSISLFSKVADKLIRHESTEEQKDVENQGATLLCFDEIQISDVFSAVALSGIFSQLMKRGVVIIATSNKSPRELLSEGIQNEALTEMVEKLEEECEPLHLDSEKDYRRINLASESIRNNFVPCYFWPLTLKVEKEIERCWDELVKKEGVPVQRGRTIQVLFGRELQIPLSCGGVAQFSFQDLCNKPLGPADYLSIAQNFHSVIVTEVPVMSAKIKDQARRFITLVDELYNHKCLLFCSAEAPPEELFLGTEEGPLLDFESLQFESVPEDGRLRQNVMERGGVAPLGKTKNAQALLETMLTGKGEEFAFQRAVSRLLEMQSLRYKLTKTNLL